MGFKSRLWEGLSKPCSWGWWPYLPSSKYIAGHFGQTIKFLFYLTTEFSSRVYFLYPCDQQQTSVEFQGATSGARASFLHGSLSAHVDVKHPWLLTLTPVFQQLLIYCRIAFQWLLVDSWPSWPVFSQQRVIVCVFLPIVAVKQPCHELYTWKLLLLWNGSKWLPDLFKSIMCSFRSMLSSSEFPMFPIM